MTTDWGSYDRDNTKLRNYWFRCTTCPAKFQSRCRDFLYRRNLRQWEVADLQRADVPVEMKGPD